MLVALAATAVAGVSVYVGRNQLAKLWVPSSAEQLEASERRMLELSGLPESAIEHLNVPCGGDGREQYYLHVIRVRGRQPGQQEEGEYGPGDEKKQFLQPPPVVLLHGFGGGIGLWCRVGGNFGFG